MRCLNLDALYQTSLIIEHPTGVQYEVEDQGGVQYYEGLLMPLVPVPVPRRICPLADALRSIVGVFKVPLLQEQVSSIEEAFAEFGLRITINRDRLHESSTLCIHVVIHDAPGRIDGFDDVLGVVLIPENKNLMFGYSED